jgi:hypothetical protein
MSLSVIGPTAPEASAPQSQKVPSAPAPAASTATLQPDTVMISPQAQKAASGDADRDGDSH